MSQFTCCKFLVIPMTIFTFLKYSLSICAQYERNSAGHNIPKFTWKETDLLLFNEIKIQCVGFTGLVSYYLFIFIVILIFSGIYQQHSLI